MPYICKNNTEIVLIVYFITSAPEHLNQRNAIRKTWGQNLNPKPIFFLGLADERVDKQILINEAKFYKDIVLENFHDTYNNLSLKTGFMLKHFFTICPSANYLMKTDDDIFINTEIIEHILKKHYEINLNMEPQLIGKRIKPYKPHRDAESKWYLPHWLYPKKLFPPYLSGTGYIITNSAINLVYETGLKTPIIPVEDVMFTGIVSHEILNITLIDNEQFNDDKPGFSKYCLYKNLATSHRINPDQMHIIWNEKLENKSDCFFYRNLNRFLEIINV